MFSDDDGIKLESNNRNHHLSSGNGDLKQRWATTVYFFRWLTSITQKTLPNAVKEYKARGNIIHCYRKCKMIQPLWRRIWQCLIKLTIIPLYDPAIPFFGIYPTDLQTYCTQIPVCKHAWQHYSQVPETGSNENIFHRWMDNETVVHLYNGRLFSKKKKKLLSHKRTMWSDLKYFQISDSSQRKKAKYFVITIIWPSATAGSQW